jgi:4-amino-4-deoxy-L-arabinose transferase-like glycosyltransferase
VFDPVGWIILAVLAVPWYAAALVIHGQDFIDGFILKHNVKRFTGSLEGHTGSLFYYIVAVPLLLLPWTSPLLASLRHVRADAATSVRRFLWIWAGFVVVFFSLSGTKLPHYVLYGATPLFLLVAIHRDSLRRPWLHLLPPTLLMAAFTALPFVASLLAQGNAGNAYYRAQLAEAGTVTTAAYYLVTTGALLLWLALARWLTASTWTKLVAGSAIATGVLITTVSPWLGNLLQGPVKEAALAARALGGPVVAWRFDAPSISVYREAVTPLRPPEPGELAITRIDRIPASGYETLFRRGGVVVVRRLAEQTQ